LPPFLPSDFDFGDDKDDDEDWVQFPSGRPGWVPSVLSASQTPP